MTLLHQILWSTKPFEISIEVAGMGGGGAEGQPGAQRVVAASGQPPKSSYGKVLKFSDKTLPPGWIRMLKQRKNGKQAGRWDVYIYSPCGVRFCSIKKLKKFFEKNNLNYDPEDFDFTPYGRGRHMDSRHVSAVSSASTSAIQAASVDSTAGWDYASFSQFDPCMEGPPNASTLGTIHMQL